MVNNCFDPIKKGHEIVIRYGKRSNAHLVENYGFTLDHTNIFTALQFRVVIGTNPKEKVPSPLSLLATDKMLSEKESLEATTELI